MDTIQSDEKLPHVIVSTFKENANQQDVEQAASKITAMIDEWNVQGNMIWTGSFNDGKSAMSVIEDSCSEINFKKRDSDFAGMIEVVIGIVFVPIDAVNPPIFS